MLAGPVEATAIGNVLMQALAFLREFSSLSEARSVVRASFEVARYELHDPTPWDEAYGRYGQVVARSAGM